MTHGNAPSRRRGFIAALASVVVALTITPVALAAESQAPRINQLVNSGFIQCEAHRSVGARANLTPGSFQTRLEAISTGRNIAPSSIGQHTHYHRPNINGGGWRVFGNPAQISNPRGTCG